MSWSSWTRLAGLDQLPDRISYPGAAALRTADGPMRPLVAIGGDTLTALGPDLADVPTFAIAGPPRTGRSTALLVAAHSLLDSGAGVVVLAPRRSPLRELEGSPGVAAVVTDAETALDTFRQVLGNVPEENAVILVDDAELFMGSEIDPDLALLARGGAGNGWGGVVVAGNAESMSLSPAWFMGQVKRNRTGMLLSPQSHGRRRRDRRQADPRRRGSGSPAGPRSAAPGGRIPDIRPGTRGRQHSLSPGDAEGRPVPRRCRPPFGVACRAGVSERL
ncbi:hypothetical protein [Streptomyces sp. RKAG293]|uniref:hypothetical protein n=1 Tax=Streptomyces sp. RKAG293 TaxID=2893403 RepID=UPI002034017E|nr:hypothetical protein [Streptomyces sp. RKAG293]MCM2422833.1 hypothetical protein [Streptomyces sp. RKAG293]